MLYYRHRRNHFALAEPSPLHRALKPAIGVVLALVILYFAGSWLMERIGLGNRARQTAVVLTVERQGSAQVSLDDKEFANAQNDMKLYASDRVKTSANGRAALMFFDGTVLRLGDQAEVAVLTSDMKTENSVLSVRLSSGQLWVSTPVSPSFTGSVLRTVEAASGIAFEIPRATDAVIGQRSVTVYSAAGLGIKLDIPGAAIPVIVGEGQQLALPENFNPNSDLYQYRSAIGSLTTVPAFVQESRTLYLTQRPKVPTQSGSGLTVEEGTELSVVSPSNNQAIHTSTVNVKGVVGSAVSTVRVNGYQATLSPDRTFAIELSLPDENAVTITIEALDPQGAVLETAVRQITRNLEPPKSPTIASPAATGQTYRTQRTELPISGSAPAGTTGIIVNDYRLQIFKPGDTTWTYLASTRLDNFHDGENIFRVYAINDAGKQSEPATLTILLGGEGEGVVNAGSAGSAAASEITSEEDLPKNAALQPGTVRVTGPVPGTQFTSTGSAFLIEGTTPPAAASVWVNGYKLRLFTPGKLFWNYIADPALGTLKRGVNTYRINVRNAQGEILDTTTYTVTY
ncbi:MAG: FecR domain-containing protein [Candidatus Peribacteraceae bacterium]|nr:FecR domain-containing protein [Candidatus Peribacteraceae bacterium]MDD5742967.1 FecR domain-containing protein [Candidatus Peribacteraceae bacterium]